MIHCSKNYAYTENVTLNAQIWKKDCKFISYDGWLQCQLE